MTIKPKDRMTPTLERQLAALGHNLRLARKRRKWSVAKVREDIGCAKGTLEDAEKGKPTVSLGVYVLLMQLYGFKVDLSVLTNPSQDTLGEALSGQASSARKPKISAADF